jgi:HSP20 family molecular chaperone IbpA
MALFPFYHYPFFADPFDPFFFHRLDFFDPWFDFDIFPAPAPIGPPFRWTKEWERRRYTSIKTTNGPQSLELSSQVPQSGQERQLQQATNDDRSLAPFGQYRDPFIDKPGYMDSSDLQPRIVDKGSNQKQLELTVGVKNYRPQDLKVSVKNNELIVQGQHQYKDEKGSGRSFFYKSTTLPSGTQVDQIQSHLNDDGQLKIEGPVL